MRTVWGTAILGLSIGLGGGFIVANFSHRTAGENVGSRNQIPAPPTETAEALIATAPENDGQANGSNETLSAAELRGAIARADRQPNNWQLQRELGMALFRYALLEENSEVLFDVIRLLERAERKPFLRDKEISQTLGDSLFILARQKEPQKDLKIMLRARSAYQKALEIEPNNPDLLVSVGLTFFYQKTPQPAAAIKLFYQALAVNPKHEKCLESLIIALLDMGKVSEAAELLQRLQEVSPNNERLDDLRLRLMQKGLKDGR